MRWILPLLAMVLLVLIATIFGCEAEPGIIITPSQQETSSPDSTLASQRVRVQQTFLVPTLEPWHLYDTALLDVEIPAEHADKAFSAVLLDDFSLPVADSSIMDRVTVTAEEAMGPEDIFQFVRNPAWFDNHIGNMKWLGVFIEYDGGGQTFIPFVWMRPGYTLNNFSADLTAGNGFAPDNLRLSANGDLTLDLLFREAPGIESLQGALYEVETLVETEIAEGEEGAPEVFVTRLTAFAQLYQNKPFTRHIPLENITAGGSTDFRMRAVWLLGGSDNELTGSWSEWVTLPVTAPSPATDPDLPEPSAD